MSASNRIHPSNEHFLANRGDEPLRTVICTSADCTIIAWHLEPGQTITPHVHPHGQDTWTVLAGSGTYCLDEQGTSAPIRAGDVVVAEARQVHGVNNTGTQPLRFISVVCPLQAGYEALVKPA
jgi:quercetin dioxygenase-like cupin family protein